MMSSPALYAEKLLNELGRPSPKDMSMEEIAYACGFMVSRKEMDGSEGRIIMNKDSGIISVNASIDYQPKINYIIAHEIGHARMHRDLIFFNDNTKTLNEWYARGNHEKEANLFAAALLMPEEQFKKIVKRRKLNLQLIEEAASYFGASKTATFLRYRDLGDFPVMIIFIQGGLVKWKSHSTDFPFTWLQINTPLPAWTVAGDFYKRGVREEAPEKVDAIEWFPEDRSITGNESQKLWEQCFPVGNDGLLTCLWTL